MRVRPRVDPGVACWALAGYQGPVRRAVLAAKEQGRRDLAVPLGKALARALVRLRDSDRCLIVIPAPSRRRAARQRGGDPVLRMARRACRELAACQVAPVLRLAGGVRDSVGLSARARRRNLSGRVRVAALPEFPETAEIVLVDDVLTTGTTVTESVRALRRAGLEVRAVVTICTAV